MMRYFILIIVFVSLGACGKQNVQPDSGSKNKGPGRNLQVPPSLVGLDETVDTQWVSEIPDINGLSTISGQIGITGSEPSVKVVIYEKENAFYALSGNEKFMNYITGYQNQQLTVSGVFFMNKDIRWLKVLYVLKK